MKVVHLFAVMVLALALTSLMNGLKYSPCPRKTEQETRWLYVATCDTRSGRKEFETLRMWNVTGKELRKKGITMENVCRGEHWGAHGFLTKPLMYLKFLRRLPTVSSRGGSVHVILMDSDTFWATNDVSAVWNKYDCARGSKEVVLSTEMSCWVGRYCTDDDITRWYNKTASTPSNSPFANSGVVMGTVGKIKAMLEYVVAHNKSYYITYFKNKFDDQYAIADYALNVRPEEVALDYHQQLLGSFAIHAPGDPHEDGWPFVCKAKTGGVCKSCPIWTNLLNRLGHFKVNQTDCLLRRKYWPNMPLEYELLSLAPDPIIWHGNGVGKRMFYDHGYSAFLCNLKTWNMTIDDHANTYGK